MASVVKLKRSSVQGKSPTTGQLELGELALNTFDGKLFAEINDGADHVIEIGSHLTNLNVTGVSTVGVLTVSNNANIDGNLFVGGIQVTGGGSVVGEDITTRNLKVTGVSTFEGNSVFESNVGIGTTTYPNEALRVEGDMRVTGVMTIGQLTYPSQDGAANQVLKTNGSGVLSFGGAASATIEHFLPIVSRTTVGVNNINQIILVPISSGINTVDARSGSVNVTQSAFVDTRPTTDPNEKALTQTFFNTFA